MRLAASAGRGRWRLGIAILLLIVGLNVIQPAMASGLDVSHAVVKDVQVNLSQAGVERDVSAPVVAAGVGHRRDLAMMFFVTAMLFLLAWAILNFVQDRQPEVGLFAVHQAVYTLFGIAAAGYLMVFFRGGPSLVVEWASAVLYFAINVTTLLFCRELFKIYEPPRLMMRGFYLLLGTSPLAIVVFAIGYRAMAIELNAALFEITWLYLAVVAFAFRVEETPRRWILQAFFVAVCLGHVAFWFGVRSGRTVFTLSFSDLRLLLFDGLVASGFFVVVLKARASHAQRRAQQSFLDLLRVQKKFAMERELKKQAVHLAQTDYLTGVFNRRFFVESAEDELAQAIRLKRPLSLLMFDIDHFKVINDTWGHAIGDVVLQGVSHLIRDALRGGDIFGRTGGEEFAAVLVATEGNYASSVAQRLCATVADAVIVPAGGERIPVTISIGLAQLTGRAISFAALMNEADQAMYAAKEAGRNRVSVNA